jgi:putative ABC transport system permease protein
MLPWWTRASSRLRLLLGFAAARREDREMREEMRFHLEQQAERFRAEGMSDEDALRAAKLAFGGVGRWSDESRDEIRSATLDDVVRDLRYAVRALRRTPTFTLAVVLSLGVGIGAVSSVYTVTDRVALRPLPYDGADRIVTLWTNFRDQPTKQGGSSWPDILDWTTNNPDLEAAAVFNVWFPLLTSGGEESQGAEPLTGASVTPDFFRVLGTRPLLGRTFDPSESEQNPPRVVLIAHSLWERRFASDPNILGKAISMNGLSYTVIGVLPPTFRDPEPFVKTTAEVWRPLVLPPGAKTRGTHFLRTIARLKPGIALDDARRHFVSIGERLAAAYPKSNESRGVYVLPMQEQVVGQSRSLLFAALGAAGCLLLIACGNVTNLVLTRQSLRTPEIAVRTAMGAGRGRIVRMLFLESLVLTVAGGLLGVAIAFAATGALRHFAPSDLPRVAEIAVDARVLAVCIAITLGTSLVLGIVPALRFSREDVAHLMRSGGAGGRATASNRIREGVVVAEVALALMLMASSLLLGRSALGLAKADLGMDVSRTYAFQLVGSGTRFASPGAELSFTRALVQRLRSIPGVEDAANTSAVPLGLGDQTALITGWEQRPSEKGFDVHVRSITGDYFGVIGMKILRGRSFTERDDADAPRVAIVNERAARDLFGSEDPIGKRLLQYRGDTLPATVVGIVADARFGGPTADPVAELYQPAAQMSWGGARGFVVRTRRDPKTLGADVRTAVREFGADLAAMNGAPLAQLASAYSQRQRFYGSTIGSFAAIGLLLSAIGIYGLIAYTAVQRRREMAIRMALGASLGGVIGKFVGRVLGLVIVGLVFGAVGATLVGRAFRTLLYGVTPGDPATVAAAAVFLAAIGVIASVLPARAATKVSLVETLRSD